jgi:hypothetical protein
MRRSNIESIARRRVSSIRAPRLRSYPHAVRDPSPLRPLRLLVIVPSWVGDAIMATPTFRLLRGTLKGSYIGALVRPGIDQLLAGLDVFDEVHVASSGGVMGPKHAAAKVRHRRYDTALLLTNSFSSALITRLAGIPNRIGYERDARGLLLSHKLDAPKRPDGSWAPVSAVRYYDTLARTFLAPDADIAPRGMELASHARAIRGQRRHPSPSRPANPPPHLPRACAACSSRWAAEVPVHPVRAADVPLAVDRVLLPRAKWKMRECSRNRPTTEITRMFSDSPGTPGRRQQNPRTISVIFTPACDASYSRSASPGPRAR